MRRLSFISALMVLGAVTGASHAQVGSTKAGLVYCNNTTGYQASCAMYYYSAPEGTPIRSEPIAVGSQTNINVDVKGPAVVVVNNGVRRAPNVTTVQHYIGQGAELTTGTMNWTATGSGLYCRTSALTCRLKEVAVLDTGCSCATKKGRVRGVVVP